jgi:hypothetical protein
MKYEMAVGGDRSKCCEIEGIKGVLAKGDFHARESKNNDWRRRAGSKHAQQTTAMIRGI